MISKLRYRLEMATKQFQVAVSRQSYTDSKTKLPPIPSSSRKPQETSFSTSLKIKEWKSARENILAGSISMPNIYKGALSTNEWQKDNITPKKCNASKSEDICKVSEVKEANRNTKDICCDLMNLLTIQAAPSFRPGAKARPTYDEKLKKRRRRNSVLRRNISVLKRWPSIPENSAFVMRTRKISQ